METPTTIRDPAALEALTNFYTALLRRWAIARSQRQGPLDFEDAAISELIRHASTLHVSILASSGATSSVLRFYEVLSSFSRPESSLDERLPITLPTPQIVYLSGFDFKLDSLSRLCSILATYKNALEDGIKNSIRFSNDVTTRFNAYLMDVCNLLWRSRAFTKTDANAAGCLSSEEVVESLRAYVSEVDRGYNISSLFGLSHNSLICALSLKVLQDLEDEAAMGTSIDPVRHVGPATQRTLAALEKESGMKLSFKEYRVHVLNWLDEKGLGGIRELMFVTMKDLMK